MWRGRKKERRGEIKVKWKLFGRRVGVLVNFRFKCEYSEEKEFFVVGMYIRFGG